MTVTSTELFSVAGKTALVTGASSGIGAAMAQFLAAAGANLILVARRRERLNAFADKYSSSSLQVLAVEADLGVESSYAMVAKQAYADFEHVDIVINAAGVNLRQAPEDITLDSWDATLDLNLKAPFFLSRAFADKMRVQGWGRVINIASMQSYRAFKNGLPYGASKGGIAQLTRAMTQAWSAEGVMCNAIAPGFFPTELTEPVFSDPSTEQWAADQTAIGRNGRMEDLQGITLFLCSRASDYVTGQIIAVDGGFSAQ